MGEPIDYSLGIIIDVCASPDFWHSDYLSSLIGQNRRLFSRAIRKGGSFGRVSIFNRVYLVTGSISFCWADIRAGLGLALGTGWLLLGAFRYTLTPGYLLSACLPFRRS